jgi:predicted CxxxxCH...CXXCH cytochrome family protein
MARTHGQAFLDDTTQCALCHGEDRNGGQSGVSCNSCHTGWESNCSFCHGGGPASSKGSPPYDTRGQSDTSLRSVGAHLAHVNNGPVHIGFECTMCHVVPENLTSEGHLDDSPGAEVVFGSLAGSAEYKQEDGSCASVACHGGATVEWTQGELTGCTACHGDDSVPDDLSGSHAGHFSEGIGCESCHKASMGPEKTFVNRAPHVNGQVDVALSIGTYDPETNNCTNTCHEPRTWGGTIHPVGWVARSEHGSAFILAQGKACTDCHGEDYLGGNSGVSCDACHQGGGSGWRTDCTFCHGGVDNNTGAPPDAAIPDSDRAQKIIGAHTEHVTARAQHRAFDCEECHVKPDAFDNLGHIDQGQSPKVAFNTDGLNADASYDMQTTGCQSLYCHGNGQEANGQAIWTGDAMTCASCHGDESTSPQTLSGRHSTHLGLSIDCATCHKDVVDDNKQIVDTDLHVNGQPNVGFSTGTWNAETQSCSSVVCHPGTMNW